MACGIRSLGCTNIRVGAQHLILAQIYQRRSASCGLGCATQVLARVETQGKCILVKARSKSEGELNKSTEEVDKDKDEGEESVGTGWRCMPRYAGIYVTQDAGAGEGRRN